MSDVLAQIQHRVRQAHAQQTPLSIRGGGTKAFHPLGAPAPGQTLELRPLAGVIEHEPTELVITVRAGTRVDEVQALLARHGQCLAFEPPQFAPGGTVGGMVASGLSGPARASVGALRDFVLGVELLNGQGELLRFGGQVMKNVAGYDVSRLMAGSWGQLAVITEVSLKVLPVAPAEATLRFELDQAQALAQLHRWGGQPLPLNASCWVQDEGRGVLYVRLRGAQAAVRSACAQMGGERLHEVQGDWDACRDHSLPWFAARAPQHALWRLSLPQTAPVLALPPGVDAPLVEWHGGLRWVQAAESAGEALRAAARAAGGSACVFRAADADGTRARAVFDLESPSLQAIHHRLKQAFDPAGIFNTGRA
ncbi:glycolate oxidase subunit GlcE [Comamonas sp. NLF-1-9]|uniref:glycolate oxidase subunit GlcE n=1 Tax=Comamonas sp. NLF-1-9 TaxID=2853163 RepID=UPI001C47EECA|nr:glycolate oxidase subunit GlcE [Comamonas sp. NLF-1-9]QXL83787.1 glycolate oxidase subunit GlcE [Comamonas sp. NLF-1-9]